MLSLRAKSSLHTSPCRINLGAAPTDRVCVCAESEGASKRVKREPAAEVDLGLSNGHGWTVSPRELREALSSLGKAAIQFDLSEMHDAAEVCGSAGVQT